MLSRKELLNRHIYKLLMDIQETPEGLILAVKVRPSSGRFSLSQSDRDLVLELSSPPQGGKANQELIKELSRVFRCEVRILDGLKSRRKILLLKGITREDIDLVLETI
jgi:uncharacterized protein (TIGR00251 family)